MENESSQQINKAYQPPLTVNSVRGFLEAYAAWRATWPYMRELEDTWFLTIMRVVSPMINQCVMFNNVTADTPALGIKLELGQELPYFSTKPPYTLTPGEKFAVVSVDRQLKTVGELFGEIDVATPEELREMVDYANGVISPYREVFAPLRRFLGMGVYRHERDIPSEWRASDPEGSVNRFLDAYESWVAHFWPDGFTQPENGACIMCRYAADTIMITTVNRFAEEEWAKEAVQRVERLKLKAS